MTEREYRMQTYTLKPIGFNHSAIILMLIHLCRLVSLSCLEHIPSHRCPPTCDHSHPIFRAQSSSSYGIFSSLLLHFAVSELGAGGIRAELAGGDFVDKEFVNFLERATLGLGVVEE